MNWRRPSPGSIKAYGFATGLVAIATLLRWGLGLIAADLQAFTTFYPAVLFATLFGGAGAGVIAAILGGIVCWWEFLPPYGSLWPLSHGDEIDFVTYFVSSALIVWATEHYRRLNQRLRDEERFRKLAVDELAHRLKNKVATIQAIINLRLHDNPEARNQIFGSLNALMATDDLIIKSQGEGANIRDILAAKISAYDYSRISIDGPRCYLSPAVALTFALLVHELATNAAKYGALSNATGKVSIARSLSGPRLTVVWRESDGPTVNPPSHSGFGTRRFYRALGQFGGTVDANFAPTGLVCNLSMVLPDRPRDVSDDSASEPADAYLKKT